MAVSDPTAACLLAIYIFHYWIRCGRQQIDLIVGRAAEPSFLEMVRDLAETHDPTMTLDTVRAYHYGPRFLVELDVVMEEVTPLRESHDVGVLLQHKVEALHSVERCFVHMDYKRRFADDHDTSTPVTHKLRMEHGMEDGDRPSSPIPGPGSVDSLTALLGSPGTQCACRAPGLAV